MLVGYRPYFDFVASAFNQQHKNKYRLHKWPHEGGVPIPTLVDYISSGKLDWPHAGELVDIFRPYADRVVAFDMTTTATATPGPSGERGDITTRFLCDLLEDAASACSAVRASDNGAGIRKNTAKSLDYDRIAFAASERGLLNHTRDHMNRERVAKRIEEFVAAEKSDATTGDRPPRDNLPLACPEVNSENNNTTSLADRLYHESLAQEMALFPDRGPHWETESLYRDFVAKGVLCVIDVDQLFNDAEWRGFFDSLEEESQSNDNQID